MVKTKILGIIALVSIVTLAGLVLSSMKTSVSDRDPPVWPDAFEESFDERFSVNNKTEIVNGMLYYDAVNKRSRLDRANGAYDSFCNSLQANVTTSCISVVTEGKRWIYFPNKKKCCMCCDSAHGCGILKPDWLSGAEYLGEQSLDGQTFEKWNKNGVVGFNHYWDTPDDNRVPRKIDENGAHIMNFNIYSYKKREQNVRLFDVPEYCTDNCPDDSTCGKMQNANLTRSDVFMI